MPLAGLLLAACVLVASLPGRASIETRATCAMPDSCVMLSKCPPSAHIQYFCNPPGPGHYDPFVCCPPAGPRPRTRRSIGEQGAAAAGASTPTRRERPPSTPPPSSSDAPAALALTARPRDEELVAIPLLPPSGAGATLGSPPPPRATLAPSQIVQRSSFPRYDGPAGADGDVWFPDVNGRRPPTPLYNRPPDDVTKRPPPPHAAGWHPRPYNASGPARTRVSAMTATTSSTGKRRPQPHYGWPAFGRDSDRDNVSWRPAADPEQRVPGGAGAGGTRAGAGAGGAPTWGPPTIAPRRRDHRHRTPTVSDRKCAEFARLQTERVVALPLVPDPRPAVQHVQKCDANSVPLVVGGQDARLHEFPHMAAIGYRAAAAGPAIRIEWNCGGSLISEVFVLTAAHCTATAQGPPIRVRLGEHNLESSEDGARPVDVAVSSMVRHPDYQPPARYHDIGLLRLARKVTFGPAIRPACLYSLGEDGEDDSLAGEPLVAIGWGHTEQLGEKSQVLQKVVLSLVDQRTCSDLYSADASTSSLARGITADSQLCAGVLEGGKDTCQGDSGGPLQVTSPNNRCVFHVVGITSFGKVCAARNSPGVYTRVAKYIPWIERHVWPEERRGGGGRDTT